MKLAVFCLCILHVTFVSAGLFTRNDLQAVHSTLSVNRAQAPQSAGSLNQGRQRPLFARRGQYERQSVPKSRVVPASPNRSPSPPPPPPPPTKVTPKPVKFKCSYLKQSCLPQSGCCEPYATCHCRFFNAICFCRRTK
ncbi:agouti-signaling protein-like [Seriola aureovittata]|uniref:agouti-signaling protein-like n=1 Tax=Seriola aureovittata TaxID=2871759 RepID=UPI0024BE50BF|nr:agouti-signaling protein-like [Seriola aureovittata]